MTLLVHRVQLINDDWHVLDDAYVDMLVGFEACRTTLWGSAPIVALGCRVLPQLRNSNVYCVGNELTALLDDTQCVLANCVSIATITGYDAEVIAYRVGNVQRAVLWAQAHGGAVWIG